MPGRCCHRRQFFEKQPWGGWRAGREGCRAGGPELTHCVRAEASPAPCLGSKCEDCWPPGLRSCVGTRTAQQWWQAVGSAQALASSELRLAGQTWRDGVLSRRAGPHFRARGPGAHETRDSEGPQVLRSGRGSRSGQPGGSVP